MSYNAYSSARTLLVNNSNVIALVPAGSIRIGFQREPEVFPMITITQVGGSAYGYLGYGQSDVGSKGRNETSMIQIDIYDRDSIMDINLIGVQVDKAIMSGAGYRKSGELDAFEDGLNSYRKVQTWMYNEVVDD